MIEQATLTEHELETIEVKPEILSVNVGSLSIEAVPREKGQIVPGYHARVLMDGKPLKTRRVVLIVDVNEAITATIEHYV